MAVSAVARLALAAAMASLPQSSAARIGFDVVSTLATAGHHDSLPPRTGASLVRLMAFDFDHTLSREHVFGTIRKFAETELGQVRYIRELDKGVKGSFAAKAFGTDARVSKLREFLEFLKERGVMLVIITRGYVGAVKRCLSDLLLLHFFDEVYGFIGSEYGETDFDMQLAPASPEEEQLLGKPQQALSHAEFQGSSYKVPVIQKLMAAHNFTSQEVVFVDDDPEEIGSANEHCHCRTLLVQDENEGIQEREMEELRSWCVPPPGWIAASARAARSWYEAGARGLRAVFGSGTGGVETAV